MRLVPAISSGAFCATLLCSAPAHAAIEAGTLTCRADATVGTVVASVRKFFCVFKPKAAERREQIYNARTGRRGVDLGISARSALSWAVFAPTEVVAPGALAGRYAAASDRVATGLGVAANALVGGARSAYALQPTGIDAQSANAKLGASGVRLAFVR